jgi:branched-chain amino acid transport system substrate-binding protein
VKPVKWSLLAVFLIAVSGCGKSTPKPETSKPLSPEDDPRAIKIGIFLPLSGMNMTFGQAALDGAKLAVSQINAAGGVTGRPVALVVEDTHSTPGDAARAVRALAAKKVVAVIGEVTSDETLAAAAVAVELGLPMVAPGATVPEVTQVGNWVFRICYVDPFPGVVMSKFAQSLGVTRAAVVYDLSNRYSNSLAAGFHDDFKNADGGIVAAETYTAGAADFSTQLKALKDSNPDVIFLPAYFADAVAIVKQARKMGIEVPFLGTDGWESEEFLKAGGTDVNNCYFASHFSAGDSSDRTWQFVTAFEGMFARQPIALSALGYDAVNFVADGIRRAGGVAADPLRDALARTKDFPGVTGNVTLDEKRNPSKSAIVIRVNDGKFTYLQTEAP